MPEAPKNHHEFIGKFKVLFFLASIGLLATGDGPHDPRFLLGLAGLCVCVSFFVD